MNVKPLYRWYDYITINIYWFALSARAQVLSSIIIPLLVQRFIGEETKGEHLGDMRWGALMIALLSQALMGMLSDRSTFRWGRRRPFIVIGTFGELIVITLIGSIIGLDGETGYWLLFILYILSMFFSNTAQAATQGLIPDIVPDDKRGIFSGVKSLFEVPIPLVFVSFFIGNMVASSNLWGALLTLLGVLITCMLITLLVPEEPRKDFPQPWQWRPFIRLITMTLAFAIIIRVNGALVKFAIYLSNILKGEVGSIFVFICGLTGILISIGLGVWASLRISLGKGLQNNLSFTWWVGNRLAFLVGATNFGGFLLFFLQEKFPELHGEKAAGPATKLLMFAGIFMLLTAIPSGWLSDRFSKKSIIAVSSLITTLGAFIIIFAPELSIIYLGGCLVGAGVGQFYVSNWSLGTKIVPEFESGRFLGLSNLAGAGAGAIGAYIGGPIGDHEGYILLMSIYGTICLLSILALKGVIENP